MAHRIQKGEVTNPNGRPKGALGKKTQEIKEAYVNLVAGNIGNISEWLERIAATDPAKAMDLLLKISPFVIPKLTEELSEAPIIFTLPKGISEIKKKEEKDGNSDNRDSED